MSAAAPRATFRRIELAQHIGRSLAAFDRDLIAGRIIPGFLIGKNRYWLRTEVEAWLAAGAPPAAEWEARKAAAGRGAPRG